MKIPICPKHNRPIKPSRAKAGRKTGCSKCYNEWRSLPQAKVKRAVKWEKFFISCAYHPNRRSNKSCYVCSGLRRCTSCNKRSKPSEGGPKRASEKAAAKRATCRWVKTRAGRECIRRCNARQQQKRRMKKAAQHPFKRKSIAEILKISTGFRTQGGE